MSTTPLLRPALPGPSHLPRRIFIGSIVTPVSLTHLRLIERGVLGVGTSGVIRFVEDLAAAEAAAATDVGADWEATPVDIPRAATGLSNVDPTLPGSALTQAMRREELAITALVERNGWKLSDCEVVRMDSGSFLCPGFIDTHTHACQVPNIGLGQQYELLDWLQHITFPRERRFEDARYARKTYESVVQRMIDSGTTCAAIYATIHEEATKILAEICNERGMRALVGKCQMDRNSPIDYIEKNASVSMEATKEFIRYTRSLRPYGETPNVKSPILSPSGGASSASPEMDASIARLSATMSEIMESESRKNSGGGEASSNSSSLEALPPAATAELSPTANTTAGAATPTPVSQSMSLTTSQANATEAAHVRRNAQLARYATQRHSSASSVHSATAIRSHTRTGTGGTQSPREARRTQEHMALVQPILTPRFAISCSDSMLASIAALLSRDPTLRVQTHLSENEGEIAFTRKLFPFASSYTAVYDHFSLLGQRTILAHAIHLDEAEMQLIRKRGCGISHCPTSNFNLRSGTSRVGEMLNRGIKVGLGTDASGGFGLGMLSAIREASVVAKVLNFPAHNSQLGGPSVAAATSLAHSAPLSSSSSTAQQQHHKETDRLVDGRGTLPPADARFRPRRPPAMQSSGSSSVPTTPLDEKDQDDVADAGAAQAAPEKSHDFCEGPLSIATLFYLATQGGAEVCSLGDTVGSLDPGKEFDALLIRTTSDWHPVKGYTGCPGMYCEVEDGIEERIEKFLFCGDDRNIGSVFIRGRVVGGADPIS